MRKFGFADDESAAATVPRVPASGWRREIHPLNRWQKRQWCTAGSARAETPHGDRIGRLVYGGASGGNDEDDARVATAVAATLHRLGENPGLREPGARGPRRAQQQASPEAPSRVVEEGCALPRV